MTQVFSGDKEHICSASVFLVEKKRSAGRLFSQNMSSHISFNITLSLALFRTVRWNIFSFLNENIDTCADLVYFLSDFAELCVCNHRYVHVCLVQWNAKTRRIVWFVFKQHLLCEAAISAILIVWPRSASTLIQP